MGLRARSQAQFDDLAVDGRACQRFGWGRIENSQKLAFVAARLHMLFTGTVLQDRFQPLGWI